MRVRRGEDEKVRKWENERGRRGEDEKVGRIEKACRLC